jgi:hypothetical protein
VRALAIATAALLACFHGDPASEGECGTGTCVADPRPHCVYTESCEDSAECPAGLQCRTPPTFPTVCPGGSDGAACRWRPPMMNMTALLDGFDTRSMRVDVVEDPPGTPRIEWETPDDATLVACAIFVCNPVFRDTAVEIANAHACILELQVMDASRTSLAPGSESRALIPECTAGEETEPVFEFLAAGCWAYDAYHIVAASELRELAPSLMANSDATFPHDAACPVDGAICYDPEREFFGACVSGICQPRCTTAQDCEMAAGSLFGAPPAKTCNWRCAPRPGSVVGVCEPTD